MRRKDHTPKTTANNQSQSKGKTARDEQTKTKKAKRQKQTAPGQRRTDHPTMPIKTEDEPTTADQHDVHLEPNNYPVELAGVEEEEPVDVLAPPEIHHHHLEDVNVDDVVVDHAVNVAVAAAVEVAVEHHEHHEHHEHLEHNAADELMAPQQPMGSVEDPLAAVAVDVGVGEVDQEQEQAALDAGEEAAAAAMEAAAAAEAAEAAIGNVLDDVGVDVHSHQATVHTDAHAEALGHMEAAAAEMHAGGATEEDEVALAAAAAAAAVQAADGMAVVVDQALLATAAAAAASQVAEVLAEQPTDISGALAPPPLPDGTHYAPPPQYHSYHDSPHAVVAAARALPPSSLPEDGEDGELLEARREKDRKRYSAMTPEARAAYNAHRRELYHKQGEAARKRRRERERDRYHSLEGESKKQRNERRAKLERDRYNRLSREELAMRNSKRRDRAKNRKNAAKQQMVHPPNIMHQGPVVVQESAVEVLVDPHATIPPPPVGLEGGVPTLPGMPHDPTMSVHGEPLAEATIDMHEAHHDHHHAAAMADASALAAEVAEQVIAGTGLDGAMEAAVAAGATMGGNGEEAHTVQI